MKFMRTILAIACLPIFSLAEASPRIFSVYYNIARTSFEARYTPNDRFYLAFVPSIVSEGRTSRNYSDNWFPNLHMDQAYSTYGYLKIFSLNQYSDLASRAGLEIQSIQSFSSFFYFTELGLRLKFIPVENWTFDLSSYPIQCSFHTYQDVSSISIFTGSSLNFGIEYFF